MWKFQIECQSSGWERRWKAVARDKIRPAALFMATMMMRKEVEDDEEEDKEEEEVDNDDEGITIKLSQIGTHLP